MDVGDLGRQSRDGVHGVLRRLLGCQPPDEADDGAVAQCEARPQVGGRRAHGAGQVEAVGDHDHGVALGQPQGHDLVRLAGGQGHHPVAGRGQHAFGGHGGPRRQQGMGGVQAADRQPLGGQPGQRPAHRGVAVHDVGAQRAREAADPGGGERVDRVGGQAPHGHLDHACPELAEPVGGARRGRVAPSDAAGRQHDHVVDLGGRPHEVGEVASGAEARRLQHVQDGAAGHAKASR